VLHLTRLSTVIPLAPDVPAGLAVLRAESATALVSLLAAMLMTKVLR